MIFVDGRTDNDKLIEILGVPEETHLDLKATVDLDLAEDRLKFVKDAVTMSNRPPGGYILIGVDDYGKPCMPIGTIPDRKRFDGARLGDLIRAYIEGEIHLRVQILEHKGNEIVVIFVPNHRDGLPVPMNKDGVYADPATGKEKVVFRSGDLFVREGAANVRIRHAHWPDLLSEYTKQIRDEANAGAQALLREFVAQRNESRENSGGRAEIPLLVNMDDDTFTDAMVALIESGNDVRLRQFIRTVKKSVSSNNSLADCVAALNKWAIFCVQSLEFERPGLVEAAIDALHGAYSQLGVGLDVTRKRLEVVIRIYAVGRMAVRLEAWDTVHSLTLKPVSFNPFDSYIFSSWIRHAQVEASRAKLFDNNRGLISAARDLIVDHAALRPDVSDDEIPPVDQLAADDVLLNSLCQFDIAYCFIVEAEGTGQGSGYPSSAAFDEDRAKLIAQKIVAEPELRRRLFPNSDDAHIAAALKEVYRGAITESVNNYGGRWWAPPPTVQHFIDSNRPA
jgi:Putative DNA-binding domain